MAVASGSYTVGDGGDYASWEAAFTDIANLTGDLTFTQISDITETGSAQITEDLNGYTLRCTSRVSHGGDPNAGYVISANIAGPLFDLQHEGSGTVEIDRLYIRSANAGFTSGIDINTITTSSIILLHHLMLDGVSQGDNGININDDTPTARIYNNVFWDWTANGLLIASGIGLNICRANTLYSNANGLNMGGNLGVCENNASFDNTADYANTALAISVDNTSSDATAAAANWLAGSGEQVNANSAAAFMSVVDTESAFLDIQSGSILEGNGFGTNPSIDVAVCIRERRIPGPRGFSRGAAEVPWRSIRSGSKMSISIGV